MYDFRSYLVADQRRIEHVLVGDIARDEQRVAPIAGARQLVEEHAVGLEIGVKV